MLVDLFVERRILIVDDFLGLLVEVFNLVFDTLLDVFVEDSEDIVLLPDIHSNLLVVALVLEEVPELQIFEIFLVHQFFQLAKKLKQLSDEEVTNDIGTLNFFAKLHRFFGDRSQENIYVSSMQQVFRVSFEGFDLLLSQSFFISNLVVFDDILLNFFTCNSSCG